MRTQERTRMKLARMCAAIVAWSALLAAAPALAANFNSGSTGADGPFAPSCAPTPCTVTVQLPASGAFNFTTGNVPAGVTVRFGKNATNTPATLLFTGDVTIAGTINVAGQPGSPGGSGLLFPNLGGAGGPGGFDGGAGSYGPPGPSNGGVGLGPGGGLTGTVVGLPICPGAGGGFGTPGQKATVSFFGSGGPVTCAAGGQAYGNPQLLPLIGGSGGGGGSTLTAWTAAAGGGGAGALLIASAGTITLTGTISAVGGAGGSVGTFFAGGGGAGGAVRLIATTLAGSGGTITVAGGAGFDTANGAGGAGRIRLEAFTNTLTATLGGAGATFAAPGPVFATTLPGLAIASVAGVAAPPAPTGSYATPDVTLPSTATSPVAVVVNATNIPLATPVVLRAKPQTGTATTATTGGLSGTLAASTASANLALDLTQPSVISAEATFQIAALDVPVKVAEAAGPDDPLTHVRVAAAFGAASAVTYITRSGRELEP